MNFLEWMGLISVCSLLGIILWVGSGYIVHRWTRKEQREVDEWVEDGIDELESWANQRKV